MANFQHLFSCRAGSDVKGGSGFPVLLGDTHSGVELQALQHCSHLSEAVMALTKSHSSRLDTRGWRPAAAATCMHVPQACKGQAFIEQINSITTMHGHLSHMLQLQPSYILLIISHSSIAIEYITTAMATRSPALLTNPNRPACAHQHHPPAPAPGHNQAAHVQQQCEALFHPLH